MAYVWGSHTAHWTVAFRESLVELVFGIICIRVFRYEWQVVARTQVRRRQFVQGLVLVGASASGLS